MCELFLLVNKFTFYSSHYVFHLCVPIFLCVYVCVIEKPLGDWTLFISPPHYQTKPIFSYTHRPLLFLCNFTPWMSSLASICLPLLSLSSSTQSRAFSAKGWRAQSRGLRVSPNWIEAAVFATWSSPASAVLTKTGEWTSSLSNLEILFVLSIHSAIAIKILCLCSSSALHGNQQTAIWWRYRP